MAARPFRSWVALCFVALVTTTLAACTTPSSTSAGTSPSATTGSPVSSSPTPTGKSPNPCLLTVRQVEKALVGKWKVKSKTANGCVYQSSKGVAFGTSVVTGSKLKAGLQAAKAACASTPQRVSITGSFACVVRSSSGTQIVGSVIARNHLWKVVIIPPATGAYGVELRAMTAILAKVRV